MGAQHEHLPDPLFCVVSSTGPSKPNFLIRVSLGTFVSGMISR